MKVTRREMLRTTVGGMATLLAFPFPASPKSKPKTNSQCLTQKNLLTIYAHVKGNTTQENIDLDNYKPIDWAGKPLVWAEKPLVLHEAFYLAIIRMSNIMFRKTLDSNSKHWMVMSPSMCGRDIFPPHQFGVWSNPGSLDGIWIKKDWRDSAIQISPGVSKVGTMNGKWTMYLAELFPQNVVMLGMGDRQVVRHKRHNNKIIAYRGPPTTHYYAIIENSPHRFGKGM